MRAALNQALAQHAPTVLLLPAFVWPAPPTDTVPMTANPALRSGFLQRAQSPVALVAPVDPAAVGRGTAPTALRRMYDEVTVAVRMHERPACLELLLASLLRRYPLLRVAVLDQSGEPLRAYFAEGAALQQLAIRSMSAAAGQAAALNAMVDMVNTRFVVMLSADHIAFDLDLVAAHKVSSSVRM
jgi:hypothetical protein